MRKTSQSSSATFSRRALFFIGVLLCTTAFGLVAWNTGSAAPSAAAKSARPIVQEVDEATRLRALEILQSDTFDMMSSAAQNRTEYLAGAKKVDGGIKPFDFAEAARKEAMVPPSILVEESPLAALANPLVNNPALDATAQKTQSETTILRTGATTAVASFNDSGSFLGGVNSFTGYSTSTDTGTSWTDRGIVPLLGDQNFGDPVLARSSSTGRVFLATLAGGANGMNIYRSDDGGVTFTGVANGVVGSSGSANTDKEWIAVDNFAGAGFGNVYHAYRDFGAPNGIFFTRSTDNGVTFTPGAGGVLIDTGTVNVQGPFVFVGADHAVYVGYYDADSTPDRIAIRKSTDQGVSFGPVVGISNLITTGTNGSLNVPAGYRSSAFPHFVASPTNANLLFAVHADITSAGGSDSNIFMNVSTDGGATWSANQRIDTDPGTKAATHPTIAITPDGTKLSITWQDSRSDPANRKVKRFGVVGTISGTTVTFSPNFAVSNPDWTPAFGVDPVVNASYMGDYDTMDADNANFYSTFVDCRNGDQDVRFALIPVAGPGAIIDFAGSNPSNLTTAANTCTDVTVTLANNGTASASGVTANFSTSTPGVTLTQNTTVAFGTIAAGATATNAIPIKMSISAGFICGTSIVINGTASTGETFSFTITTAGAGYSFTTSTGTIPAGGTLVAGSAADDAVVNLTLPAGWTSNVYGTAVTALTADTNGNLRVNAPGGTFSRDNLPLPTVGANNPSLPAGTPVLFPLWDDWDLSSAGVTGGGIFTNTTGVAPNRQFIVEWRGDFFNVAGTAITANFAVILTEGTGSIQYVYTLAGAGTHAGGVTAGIGVQAATTGTNFTQFSNNTASVSNGQLLTGALGTCSPGAGTCAAPTATPTATATATPTATATATPTATATATPTATATATPTSTPTSTPTPPPGGGAIPQVAEVEPNNTAGTAQLLTLSCNSAVVNGAVATSGDLDFYRVDGVPAGAKAWFYADTGGTLISGDRDSFIEVFAADGTTIIESDDDDGTGNGGDGTEETGLASSVAGRTLTAGGTYYFRVRGFGTAPGTSVVNPYKAFVTITNTTPVAETEPNDTSATATALIGAGQQTGVASGVRSTSTDTDFYSVQATAGRTMFISMDGDPTRTGANTLDGVVSLIASNGTTVLVTADSGFGGANNSEGFDFLIPATGTYYVRVAGFGAEAGRAYNLMVQNGEACVVGCAPFTNAIVYDDFQQGPTGPYQTALTNLAIPYTEFSTLATFNAAVALANPANTVVIVDHGNAFGSFDGSPVSTFVTNGGRVIFSSFEMDISPGMRTTFQVSSAIDITTPQSVFNWTGSPLFAGLPNPLGPGPEFFGDNGDRFEPTGGAVAHAGFVAAPTASQAAIVVGNGGRTILQGFLIDETPVTLPQRVTLATNEINLVGCPAPPTADLSITKTDGLTQVDAGSPVTYTIVASNAGPGAVTGATVTDTFSATLTGVTWTCVGAGGGTCPAAGSGNINALVNLPSGGSVTFTATGTVAPNAIGLLSNTASVAPPAGITDPNLANNSATDTTNVRPQVDLAITKTDGVTTVTTPGTTTYTIVVTNNGFHPAVNAIVTDIFPAGVTVDNWTCLPQNGALCTLDGAGNIIQNVYIPVGGILTYTVPASIAAGQTGQLINTATVTAPPTVFDPNLANNTSTDTDTYGMSISGNVQQFVQGGPNTNLAGVLITAQPGGATATTNASGNYTIAGTPGTTYTLTPTMAGKVFDPASRVVTSTANVTGVDFIAYNSPNGIPRNIFVVNTHATPGNAVTVPIRMTSQGTEKTMAFSIDYPLERLFSPVVTCGASTAGCAVVSTNVNPGKLGITITAAGAGVAAGLREIANITFQTNVGFAPPNAALDFSDTPTARSVLNATNNTLQATYTNGFVVFVDGVESDVAGRNSGNGDVLATDVTQVRRFVANLDATNPAFNEFQRADAAPFASRGDGELLPGDVVQARRYASRLDALTAAAGPAGPPLPALGTGPQPVEERMITTDREFRVTTERADPGQNIGLGVEYSPQGDEAAVSFTLEFNAARLTNPKINLGDGMPEGTVLTINDNDIANGRIGILIDSTTPLGIGSNIKRLITVTFDVAAGAAGGESRVTLTGSLAPKGVSDAMGNTLEARYTDGAVLISGPLANGTEVAGRVTTPDGRGIRGAKVTILDATGRARTVTTGTFGYYRFDDMAAGETYTIGITSNRYGFTSKTITTDPTLAAVDFIAQD